MNSGQEMFFHFFMERVKEEQKEQAELLLNTCFAKQEEGTFDRAYFDETAPKLYDMIRPESMDEVKKAMDHFASRI